MSTAPDQVFPWQTACLDAIKALGGKPCPPDRCFDLPGWETMKRICQCEPPFENGCRGPNPPDDCCAYTLASPIPVFPDACFCCCGGPPGATTTVAGEHTRPIREYHPGDEVVVTEPFRTTAWARREIVWSGGVADAGAAMVAVRHGAPDAVETLIVSRDQPFLTADQEVKPAAELIAGDDALVDGDGSPRPVVSVGPAPEGTHPLHQVATSLEPTTDPAGHLLLVNGVIAGDWALQVGLMTRRRDEPSTIAT